VGDIILAFDGKTKLPREADLFAYAMMQHKPGDKVAVTVLRDGQKVELMLPMQP
jgi:S1-C subfamily serine protease